MMLLAENEQLLETAVSREDARCVQADRHGHRGSGRGQSQCQFHDRLHGWAVDIWFFFYRLVCLNRSSSSIIIRPEEEEDDLIIFKWITKHDSLCIIRQLFVGFFWFLSFAYTPPYSQSTVNFTGSRKSSLSNNRCVQFAIENIHQLENVLLCPDRIWQS